MAIAKQDDFTKALIGFVEDGLAKEVAKIAERHKAEIEKDVEAAMSDIVAKLSTRVARSFSMRDLQDRVEIVVHKDFTPTASAAGIPKKAK